MVSVADLRGAVDAANQMNDIIFQHIQLIKEKSGELEGACRAMLDTSAQQGAELAIAGLAILNERLEEALAGPLQVKEGFQMIQAAL